MDDKHIYIADDDDHIREAIKIFLENVGYQVTAFTNGEDLLAAVKQKPCDLAVLDIMMEGIDGFAVCQLKSAAALVALEAN